METEPSAQFDLSVFKEENDGQCCKSDHTNCTSIRRLLAALKYFSVLNITNNRNRCDIFNDFINDVYGRQLLDDYTHLLNEHSQELQKIHASIINTKQFSKCEIKTCHFTSRHQGSGHQEIDANNINGETLDTKLNFYKQTMDSLHFYLFHCFDAGLRTMKHDDNETKTDDDDNKNNFEYFDAEFSRINKMISERKHITNSFNRFKTKNTKFSIITTDNEHKTG